ncbi:RNA polymerase sigma factor [Pendulispora albinea]|uniref:RNA polymerase sigma factor n=1 Tax=Pendulispora albinea TaxID=2741071 RepID=A0ABZ2M0Z6_9BACT
MSTSSTDSLGELSGTVKGSWHQFLDVYEPLRPELYRYCRYLTRSPWDAEDLTQDTLARAFSTLARMVEGPPNPKAWLFRMASNLWIDQMRRRRELAFSERLEGEPAIPHELHEPHEPRAAREAAGTLLVRLSPQERAAVVLKDVFELTLEEIAEALSTTTGTVKTALHRGRGKLVEPEPEKAAEPAAAAVLDAFCDAFNARDLDRLTALMLDTSTIDVVGVTTEYGAKSARIRILPGMLFGSEKLADPTWTGIDWSLRKGSHPTPPRAEVRIYRGEPLLLSWYQHDDGEAVRAITRIAVEGDRIAHLQNYFYTPDFIADVCRELGVPFRINGYRYWK